MKSQKKYKVEIRNSESNELFIDLGIYETEDDANYVAERWFESFISPSDDAGDLEYQVKAV